MSTTWPNKSDAAKPEIASLFHAGRQWRGVANLCVKPMSQILPLALLVLAATGCVVPTPPISTVVSGHKHSRTEIAFLNEPNATSAEVIATLGPATHESRDGRILAYVWTTTTPRGAWMVGVPGSVALLGESGVWESPRRLALLIAIDGEGIVTRHEVCRIAMDTTLEDECAKWSRKERR